MRTSGLYVGRDIRYPHLIDRLHKHGYYGFSSAGTIAFAEISRLEMLLIGVEYDGIYSATEQESESNLIRIC